MADVLSALENAEGERREEVAGGQEAGGRAQREAGALAQEGAHLLELRDVVLVEDALLLELGEHGAVLEARVLRHQVEHGAEHLAPGLVLDVAVRDRRNGVAVLEAERDLGDLLAALAVDLVREARVAHVELRLVFGHQVVAAVQLGGVLREPRRLHADRVLVDQLDAAERVGLAQRPDQLQQVRARHVHLDEDVVLHVLLARLARLQVDDGAVVRLDGLQDAAQRAHAVAQVDDECGALERFLRFRRLRRSAGDQHLFLGQTRI